MTLAATVTLTPPVGQASLTWPEKAAPATLAVPSVRCVERFGLPDTDTAGDGNALLWGDNLDALAYLLANGWRERIRLIYIDPPYASNALYRRKVRLRNARATQLTQKVEYRDQWSDDAYLQFMYARLLALRELLAPDGSLWLHCDYRQMPRLHLLLEEIFGRDNYLNTIAWRSQVTRGAKVDAFYFPNSTQYIEIFAKERQTPTLWRPQRKQLVFTRRQAAAQFMEDDRGFFRTSDPGTYSFARLKELHAAGRLYAPYRGEIVVDEAAQRVYASAGGNIGVKYYLTQLDDGRFAAERGIDNLWDDIPGLGTTPGEDVGYPTQKTTALLQRIIGASTDPGDWVLDAFAGSGTTPLTAGQMGRRWLACDENYGAIQATRRRLQMATGADFSLLALHQPDATTATPVECAPRIDLQIQRVGADRATIEVALGDVHAPAVVKLLAEQGRAATAAWREWIDAVEIDACFDGQTFRPTLVDAPHGKRSQVKGVYEMPISAQSTSLAVRITDILGNEATVLRTVP